MATGRLLEHIALAIPHMSLTAHGEPVVLAALYTLSTGTTSVANVGLRLSAGDSET